MDLFINIIYRIGVEEIKETRRSVQFYKQKKKSFRIDVI